MPDMVGVIYITIGAAGFNGNNISLNTLFPSLPDSKENWWLVTSRFLKSLIHNNNIKVDAKLVTQIEKVNIDTELLIQELNERLYVHSNNKPMDDKNNQNNANAIRINESASVNSVNKLIDDKGSLTNVSVVELNQEDSDLKTREDKEINKNSDMEQASSTNTQCHTLDRIDETRRTSTRNKKPPSSRTNDNFLW